MMDATPQRLNTDDVSSNNPVPNDGPPAYDALEEDINPPVYTHIERPPLPIRRLNLSRSAGSPEYSTITPGQCVAHLKFVAVISDLRDSIISNDGLFGINDNDADDFLEQKNEALVLLREKRWAIYTARAVERYTAWWNNYVPYSSPPPKLKDIESKEYGKITECETQVQWFQETMPPLDILMVWHSHMLNPRAFLEDCIRYGKMSLWKSGFPWLAIDTCINNRLEYQVIDVAKSFFKTTTGLEWDNTHDSPSKSVDCPSCEESVSVPWTAGGVCASIPQIFRSFHGYADKNFSATCPHCQIQIDHELLKVAKFRRDVRLLLEKDLPMPGTFFNLRGIPESHNSGSGWYNRQFPNRFLQAAGKHMLSTIHPCLNQCKNMIALRDEFEKTFKIEKIRRAANCGFRDFSVRLADRMTFRRMMSRYWDNESPFALDLVGAVIRQGSFIQKMDNIDWLHSPALPETMSRLVKKYSIFFAIMTSAPRRMAVPTLDVDLAWHTHQLTPYRYFQYSINAWRAGYPPIFIDHDDKVDEVKLSDGFEWTSKMYKKFTDGEIYSECTCWYCEAVRAPDLRDGFFVSSSTSRARKLAAELHSRPDISPNPDKNAHISAHSAVRAQLPYHPADIRRMKALYLKCNYEKACRRAQKRGSLSGKTPDPPTDKGRSESNGNNDPTSATGSRRFEPAFGPQICVGAYAANPTCMSLAPGSYGNCAAGTCGGKVAAGSCGAMGSYSGSAACGGGGIGSCGASGSCGGGGGGGS
ncbi:hypothetical protein ASPWEDRAFT_511187 [Aspergillus wentii DTO 134E9]|uniref:Alpha-ketoglutarate-dependent sulfonate dioxygenase n=1 Tax=Aspergillus wentii DTO 134E9 TaxID=1073089 RepID=A0A1L9RKQ2_ASPWE|nr:uncharacterized protein ASPWEDRAFT_511187 [Aspergillus wentii DTO 134E9]OJJ35484.1 hypothetical protein ASPWEDRAFT_511187 [Aspergillus wentii DTO 134E9]